MYFLFLILPFALPGDLADATIALYTDEHLSITNYPQSDNPNDNKLSTINSPITRIPLLNGYYSSVISLSFRPQLVKSWIALSTGKTTIQWISIRETNCAIQWIEIHPVDSVIHLARVVQTLDSAIHRISHCLVDKY